jgi:hypothetical protein
VIIYTLRDEEPFQSLYRDGTVRPVEREYLDFVELGVDGFFTDSPGTGRTELNELMGGVGLGGPEVDWNTLTEEVTRNFEQTGRWYL